MPLVRRGFWSRRRRCRGAQKRTVASGTAARLLERRHQYRLELNQELSQLLTMSAQQRA